MKTLLVTTTALLLLASCRKRYEAPVPSLDWPAFNAATTKLAAAQGRRLEGVYTIGAGGDKFGTEAAAKWSYTANGTDTVYHLSFFCEKDVSYIICEGRRVDSTILLNGYWRRMLGTETGRVRLTLTAADGSRIVLNPSSVIAPGSINISGVFGEGEEVPNTPVQFRYARPLNPAPLEIVAHRGGGRTSDLLPASENSVELIRMASRFGATGVEIDVRRTSDGQLILFHDASLNERLIQKNGMVGSVENYSYAQLSLVRLINGERIPTARQAMDAILYNTGLRYVWLDTKYVGDMQPLRDLQAEYQQKAAAIGRTLFVTIGIPDEEVLNNFKRLPNYRSIPSVNELTRADVQDVNSAIWAPRFTLGLQNNEVQAVQAEGRRAFVWTLDQPETIQDYLANGRFNGILSNYPSAVAYYHYAKQ